MINGGGETVPRVAPLRKEGQVGFIVVKIVLFTNVGFIGRSKGAHRDHPLVEQRLEASLYVLNEELRRVATKRQVAKRYVGPDGRSYGCLIMVCLPRGIQGCIKRGGTRGQIATQGREAQCDVDARMKDHFDSGGWGVFTGFPRLADDLLLDGGF